MKKQLYIGITLIAWFLLIGTMNGAETGEISALKAILLCVLYGAVGLFGLIKSDAFK